MNSLFWKFIALFFGLTVMYGARIEAAADANKVELPLRSLSVEIGDNSKEKILDQLKYFSEKNGFAIRIAPIGPAREHVLVQMWRDDIKAIATSPFERAQFSIRFYLNSKLPVSPNQLDILVEDLTLDLQLVAGVRVKDIQ